MKIDKINEFKRKRILVIGDAMVDKYISGSSDRISPEAPVPVVEVDKETLLPGGAANVMRNVSSLGAKVLAMCVVGDDSNGEWLKNKLADLGASTDFIVTDKKRPTTTKTRIVVGHSHIARIDHELTHELDVEHTKRLISRLNECIEEIDGIIISDYDKGFMTSLLIRAIIKTATGHHKPILVDPKIRHHLDYKNVDIIKTNMVNAMAVAHIRAQPDIDKKICTSIMNKLQSKYVIVTKGKEGMLIMHDKKFTIIPAIAKDVFDVTGAGDVVAAVLGLSYFSGFTIGESAILSTLAAGIKVGKLGTYAVTPDDMLKAYDMHGDIDCLQTV